MLLYDDDDDDDTYICHRDGTDLIPAPHNSGSDFRE